MKRIRLPKVSKKDSLTIPFTATMELAESIDSAVSLKIYLLLKYKEYDQIINADIDPLHYDNCERFGQDYQIVSMLKKMENIPSSIDTRQVALNKFLAAEEQCKAFNDLVFSEYGGATDKNGRDRSNLISKVSKKISHILGKCPTVNELDCDFGPGATSVSSGVSVSKADKLSAKLHCTREIPDMLIENIKDCPVKLGAFFGIESSIEGKFSPLDTHFYITDYNSLAFVPKNAKTDRAICVEPHLNTFIQKGVGRFIKKKLSRIGLDIGRSVVADEMMSQLELNEVFRDGIDISRQAGINSVYAKEGSIYGNFATIDLSAASDTISLGLVFHLLDPEWFELLNNCRSEFTKLPDGSVIENEKFSSMGNGFTFELESLIFYALILTLRDEFKGHEDFNAVMRDINPNAVMTYGDDIIVPTYMASRAIEGLELFGFSLNVEKSFTSGPFRESCGKDYFLGQLVRPYFIKKEIKNVKDLYSITNGIRNMAIRFANFSFKFTGEGADKMAYGAWRSVIRNIPKKFRYYGPQMLGDSVIFVSRDVNTTNSQSKYYTGVLQVRQLTDLLLKRSLSRYGGGEALAAALYGVRERFSLRGSKIGHQENSTHVAEQDWPRDVGRWL